MQPVLDIFIFLAHFAGVAFVAFFALWWLGPGRRRDAVSRLLPGTTGFFASSVSLGILGCFVGISVWYLTCSGFAGEVESVVASLAWQVQSGQTLYTTFEQAERYSVLYGPSVFLTNGLFLKILGPSLASTKLASSLAAIGSLLLLYASVARRGRDPLALAVTAGAALCYWAQGFAIYLVRPDALLVFGVALSLYAALRTSRWVAIALIAAMAGFAINLKVHGGLYCVPALVLLLQRHGRRAVLWAVLGAAVVTLAPFALYPQISLVNYVGWLAAEAGHGLRLGLLWLPLRYTILMFLPLAVVAALRGRRLGPLGSDRAFVLATLGVAALNLFFSMKPGAGFVYLLPVVPPAMLAVGRLARPLLEARQPVWDGRVARSAAAAVVLTVVLAGSVNEYRAVRVLDWQLGQLPGLAEDVQQIMARYEGVPMAMAVAGENRWFRTTWLRPLLVFQGNPVLVDPVSVMDTTKSGMDLSSRTYAAISEGRIPMWLVPREQEPFRKTSWYDPDVEIFPDDFIENFRRSYTLRDHTQYFDLWFWNGMDASQGALARTGAQAAPRL